MSSLTDEIRNYLSRTHAYAWELASAKSTKPDEPALVHAFLADEMWPVLQGILRAKAAPGSDIIVRGIFTHQTPYVREQTKSSGCELADLMLVRMHMSLGSHAPSYGKALLLQAKHTAEPATGPLKAKGDSAQLTLYKHWNPFMGTSRLSASPPATPLGTYWDFKDSCSPPAWPLTAQYVTVLQGQPFKLRDPSQPATCAVDFGPSHAQIAANNWPGNSVWANGQIGPASKALTGVDCAVDFSETLVDFVKGQCGRPFEILSVAGVSHWSLFVAEMLRFAGLKDYSFGPKALPRTQFAHAFCSVLPIIAEQQARDFVTTGNPSFDFTNNGVRSFLRARSSHGMGGAPVQAEELGPNYPQSIPILLVLSYGDEPRFD